MARSPFGRLPRVQGEWWLTAWVVGPRGEQHGRQSHALLHAPTGLAALQLPIVETIRARLLSGLTPGDYRIMLDVRARRGEVVPHVN